MRKCFYIILLLGGLLVSCDIESSQNGDLDGYWHLTGVDTIANSKHTDLSQEKLFWGFQMNILQMRGSGQDLYFRFSHQGDVLILSQPHLKDRENGDPEVTEEYYPLMYPYGVNQPEERFSVLHLSGNEMTLQSSTLRLQFRKM